MFIETSIVIFFFLGGYVFGRIQTQRKINKNLFRRGIKK